MGVLASGEFGKGFVLAKVPSANGLGWQWSEPAFYSLIGGSIGLTTGMSLHFTENDQSLMSRPFQQHAHPQPSSTVYTPDDAPAL